MIFRRFPNFGKELRRPFEVHAICYDCADFYDDCRGYPADRDKGQNRPQCEKYQRLADVMPGTCGQRFPETRNERPAERQEDPAPAEQKRQPRPTRPKGEPRLCDCGATLPKGRRLCDLCRAANRRATMREAKRRYRAASTAVQPHSDVPLGPRRPHLFSLAWTNGGQGVSGKAPPDSCK